MKFSNLNNINIFKYELGISEGSDSYSALYPPGSNCSNAKALGKYQFIPAQIKTIANYLKISVPTNCEFYNWPALQEKFFEGHVNYILEYVFNNKLDASIGNIIVGKNKYKKAVPINIYGLIAGAHLGGNTGLKNFIRDGKDASDALGTYISDYVAKFSDKVPAASQNTFDLASLGILLFAIEVLT